MPPTGHIERLKLAAVICFAFFVVELIFGLISNSLSVVSDALHLSTDLVSFCIAIFSSSISKRPPKGNATFGLGRAEVLSAFCSILLLWILTAGLVISAVQRIKSILEGNQEKVDGKMMAIVAAIGVGVNLSLATILGVESHVHLPGADHGHSHDHNSHCSHHAEADGGADVEEGGDGPLHSTNLNNSICSMKSDEGSISLPLSENMFGDLPTTDNKKCSPPPDPPPPINWWEYSRYSCGAAGHDHASHDHAANEYSPPPQLNQKSLRQEDSPDKLLLPILTIPIKRNINLQAAYLHVLGDLLQSVAVLIAGLIIYFEPTYVMADPVCTLIFSAIVFASTRSVIKSSFDCLLEKAPTSLNPEEVLEALVNSGRVFDVHKFRIWNVSLDKTILTCHCSCEWDAKEAVEVVKHIARQYGIYDCTVSVSINGEECALCT